MIEKISLEQFQQIKNQLAQMIKEFQDNDEAHKNDENYDYSAEEQRFNDKYLETQNRLLKYDLSDIPFEAWQGMQIMSDETHTLDFSKTRANIDFNLVNYDGNCNFKGCNVRNLEKLVGVLNPKDFDEETIRVNSSLFLSDSFSEEFKDKYYRRTVSVSDLATLPSQQLDEIKQKDIRTYMNTDYHEYYIIETLGIDKAVQLYKKSPDEYTSLNKLTSMYGFASKSSNLSTFEEYIQQLKSADVSELKNICFDYARKRITNSNVHIYINEYPQSFINENSDIFLVNANIPGEVKERYFNRSLKIQDLLDYPEVFGNIPIDYFMEYGGHSLYIIEFFRDNYGMGKFQELVLKHPELFAHILQKNEIFEFLKYLTVKKDLNSAFVSAAKEYFFNYGMPENFKIVSEGQTIYNVPEWITSMNFQFVDKLNTNDELLQYTDSICIIDSKQRNALNILGIDNIRKFEKDTGFFTHKSYEWSDDLEMFTAFSSYFKAHSQIELKEQGIDFNNGNLSYEDFLTQFANCLENMRINNVFIEHPNYDWIQGNFRESHQEIFIDLNAPDELKEAFYKNRINPELLNQHKDYVKYLVNKNLLKTINANMKLTVPGLIDEQGRMMPSFSNFIEEYVSRYGNEKFLQLCTKYGDVLSKITISSLNNEIENEQTIEKSLRNAIYNEIVNGKMNYYYLINVPELIAEYPKIFVNFDNLTNISQEERKRLTNAFYSRTLSFDDVKKYPELANVLKDKNLSIAFGNKDGKHYQGRILLDEGNGRTTDKKYSDLELLEVFGNEKFLQLCAKYGRYMDGISQHLSKDVTIRNGKYLDLVGNIDLENGLSIEDISKRIESIIARESKLGNINYYPDDAPDFLKNNYPELFLDSDAPNNLKYFFYNYGNNYPMSFVVLQKNKDWLTFLKDKALTTSLLRSNIQKKELIHYLNLFGEEKGIKLGISKAETVKEMMASSQVELMKSWYDKTGGKFIPDFVVMQNFRIEDADKFLASGPNWSKLMRIQSFSSNPEARDAMLKLAYSFGAFDQDQRGFKKLQDLLTSLPGKINSQQGHIIDRLDNQIDLYSQRGVFFKNTAVIDENGNVTYKAPNMTLEEKEEAYNKMIEYAKKKSFIDLLDTDTLVNLLEALKKEKVDIDFSKPIFSQLYRKNEDESYSLTINPQSCQKSAQIVRGILEKFRELPILTPDKAHQLFGGLELKYDADFREFLLANMDKIMENPEYVSLIASVQRQFSDIKAINSNRTLTLELAVSYVQTNRFTSVNVGNEHVAEISAIAGYSQADFNTLQKIYNYGKQRTFSSIPRIEQRAEKASGRYTYETLRLDDPLAMAIGTLTDCCQELGDCAEVCMEHSMVDKNGRVFVIRDEQGNIVAQSWVWRNKDVLCFDNIEIPDKAFARAGKEHPELGRKRFTDEIFEIYKQAAHDLIEEDKKIYKELLESGKITQEQYDGLRLGKVTVGLGYNDIAESLKQNSEVDRGTVSRPLPFEEPVKLSRGLYTSDSITQYILEEREDRKKYDGETLSVHSDDYIEYTDENFTEKSLLTLEKLEIITKEEPRYLETSVSDYADSKHLVTEIARNYGLNPKTTRIIMNPNFAIIYDVNGDKLKIGDLLYNTRVDNEQQQMNIENQVVIQMRLALEQISSDKKIDVSDLDEKQKKMYEKVTGLTDEMDIERGVGHAR